MKKCLVGKKRQGSLLFVDFFYRKSKQLTYALLVLMQIVTPNAAGGNNKVINHSQFTSIKGETERNQSQI